MKNFLLPLICVHALTLAHAIDHQPDHHLVKYRDHSGPPPPGHGSRRVKTSYKVLNSRKTSPAYPPKSSYGPPSKYKKSYYSESPPNFDFRGPTGPSGYNYKNKAFIPPSDSDLLSFPSSGYGGPPKSYRPPYPSYEEPSKYRGPPKRSPTYESSGFGSFNKYGPPPPSGSNHFDRPTGQYGPPEIVSPSKLKKPLKGIMYLPKGPNPGFVIPEDLPQGYLPPSKNPSTAYGPPKFSQSKPYSFKDFPPTPPKNKYSSYSSYFPQKESKKPIKSYPFTSKPVKNYYNPQPPTSFSSNVPYPQSTVKFHQKPQSDFPQSGYGAPNNIPLNNYNNSPAPTFSGQNSNDYSYNNRGTSFQYQTPHLSYSYSNNPQPPTQSHHYTPPDAPPSQYHPPDLNYVKQQDDVHYELPQKSISYEFHTVTNEQPKTNYPPKNEQQGSYSSYHPTSSDTLQQNEDSNRYVRGSVTSVSPHEDDDQLKNVEIHLQSSKKPPMGFSKPSEKDNESVYGQKIVNQENQSQNS